MMWKAGLSLSTYPERAKARNAKGEPIRRPRCVPLSDTFNGEWVRSTDGSRSSSSPRRSMTCRHITARSAESIPTGTIPRGDGVTRARCCSGCPSNGGGRSAEEGFRAASSRTADRGRQAPAIMLPSAHLVGRLQYHHLPPGGAEAPGRTDPVSPAPMTNPSTGSTARNHPGLLLEILSMDIPPLTYPGPIVRGGICLVPGALGRCRPLAAPTRSADRSTGRASPTAQSV